MKSITSFSDKLLIKAASVYSYEMSRYDLYDDPILHVQQEVLSDFTNRYKITHVENKAFVRDDRLIDLRYILIEDVISHEFALVYQGSDKETSSMFSGRNKDWANNLSNAAHMSSDNYDVAKAEFEYFKFEKGYNITAVSGNSLGGGYALNLAEYYPNIRIIGLNPSPNYFGNTFFDSHNATILITSTDILSRMLILDKSRIKDVVSDRDVEDKNKIDKLTDVFGYKPYYVNRSIYYFNKDDISSAHVGSLIDYRESVKSVFSQNKVHYSSRILTNNKSLSDFTKYMLKLPINNFTHTEDIDFVDNYIYPNLHDYSLKMIDHLSEFPGIAQFLLYDSMSLDLIEDDGRLLYQSDYKISNNKQFINNAMNNIDNYKKTTQYLLVNADHMVNESSDETLKNVFKKTFFSNKLSGGIEVAFSTLKEIPNLPLPILVKLKDLIELNFKFTKGFMKSISDVLFIDESLLDTELSNSNHVLYDEFIKDLEALNDTLITNLYRVVNNIELSLIKDGINKKSKLENVYEKIEPLKLDAVKSKYDSKDYARLDYQYLKLTEIVEENYDDIEGNFIELMDITKESLGYYIEDLDKRLLADDQKELRHLRNQLNSLISNVDFRSFSILLINEFKKDFARYLLRYSSAMQIERNIRQYTEVSEYLNRYVLNLELYVHHNFIKRDRDIHLNNIDIIKTDIQNINKILENFMHLS